MTDKPKYWKNIIVDMHMDTIQALKESKPGTLEWDFCMASLKAYETWYLGNNEEGNKE